MIRGTGLAMFSMHRRPSTVRQMFCTVRLDLPNKPKICPLTSLYRCFNVVKVVALDQHLHRWSSIHCMEESAALLRIRVVEVIVEEMNNSLGTVNVRRPP